MSALTILPLGQLEIPASAVPAVPGSENLTDEQKGTIERLGNNIADSIGKSKLFSGFFDKAGETPKIGISKETMDKLRGAYASGLQTYQSLKVADECKQKEKELRDASKEFDKIMEQSWKDLDEAIKMIELTGSAAIVAVEQRMAETQARIAAFAKQWDATKKATGPLLVGAGIAAAGTVLVGAQLFGGDSDGGGIDLNI